MVDVVRSALSDRLRVRVCAIVVSEGGVLMVHMQSPTRPEPIWTPPGGGLEFGEPLRDGVAREVLEETGLIVEPRHLMYTSEFIKPPFHAVEYYWYCYLTGGSLSLGKDPEFSDEDQFLKSVGYLNLDSLADHPVFPEYIRHNLRNDLQNDNRCTIHFSQIF